MAPGTPLSVDAEEYLSYLAVERGRAANSIISYRRDLVAYERYLGGRRMELREVTPAVVEEYLGTLAESGLAASSRARALAAIRGLHAFCLDERGAPVDPTVQVEGPRVPEGVPKALSEAEVARLLDSVVGDDPRARRDRAILELLYATGIRISELAGLSIIDLDPTGGVVRVLGKGSKERIVPVGRLALAACRGLARPRGAAVSGGRKDARPLGRPGAIDLDPRSSDESSGHLDRGEHPGTPGGARRPDHTPRAPPLVRHPPAGPRGGHPGRPGAPGPRLDHHDPGLHEGFPGASAPGVPGGAPPGAPWPDPRRRRPVIRRSAGHLVYQVGAPAN